MTAETQSNIEARRVAAWCASAAVSVAALVLLSWLCGCWRWGAWGPHDVPMAPSTAWLFLLLGVALFWRNRRPGHRAAMGWVLFASIVTTGFCALSLSPWASATTRVVERWLAGSETTPGGVTLGRMSPVTAMAFLMAAPALLAGGAGGLRREALRRVTAIGGVAVSGSGLVMVLVWAVGAPVIYSSGMLPVALLTAVTFMVLGAGLLFDAGPDRWPVRMLAAARSPAQAKSLRRLGWLLTGILLASFSATSVAVVCYLHWLDLAAREEAENNLDAVANLKVSQIVSWRQERLGDAQVIFNAPLIGDHVRAYLAASSREELRGEIAGWLESVRAAYDYEQVVLLDGALGVRLSAPATVKAMDPCGRREAQEAMRAREIRFSDLHRMGADDGIHLDLIVPLLADGLGGSHAGAEGAAPAPPRGTAVGAVLLRINPQKFLYPLIQTWPTASRTAESVLVRREGNEVVFLNKPRHWTNAALSLRVPIGRRDLPVAMVARGEAGMVEGVDYRGVPVLAAVRAVPRSPWFLVAKVDQEEVYAALRAQARMVWGGMGLLMVASCLGIALLWHRRDMQLLREHLRAEDEKRGLAERVEHLMQSVNDIILIADEQWRIVEANDRATEVLGYSRAELKAMRVPDLRAEQGCGEFERQTGQLASEGRAFYETVNRRKDGSLVPLEVSLRIAEIGGVRYRLGIARDISMRRQAETALAVRARQQAVVAELGQRALAGAELRALFDGAVARVAETLGVEYCKVLELQPDGGSLRLVAGVGWKEGLIGRATVGVDRASQAGFTLRSGNPVVVEDLRAETRFSGPALLLDHGVVSGLSVVIGDAEKPFGVLGAHSARRRVFSPDDASFLRAVATVLGVAVQRLQAEDALRQAEEKYRGIFENAVEGIYQSTPDGVILSANPAMAAIHGYASPEEFIAGVRDIAGQLYVEPERRAEFQRLMEAQGQVTNFECQVRRKDGRLIWISANARVVRDAGGRILFYEGIVEDITQRKQTEEERARLAIAMEQSAEDVIITDTHGAILYVNPAFEKNTGYSRREALGQNPRLLKSGRQDAAFYRELWGTLLRGEVWHGRFINKRKDGTLCESDSTISPVRDAAGKVVNYVAVNLDVTREAQLEGQLRQAQKMETIGRLAGGVAHDFNNLLTAILGYSDLALKTVPAESPLRHHLQEVKAAGERAASLTRQLLAFSRKQALQPVVLDLSDLVTNITKMLRRLIGENIRLMTRFDPGLGRVKADPSQVEQVITNLAVNARDAMPEGGTLTIETANAELDETYARRHAEVTPGRYVMLTVSDTGVGMTEDVQAHLFEPFFTTKEVGKGTGLGLASVFGIVKQSGGHITVYSEAGHGTAFKIYLPSVEDAAKTSLEDTHSAELPRGTETVLLVEDEPQVRGMARMVLEDCGYTVLVAGTGAEALQAAREHKGRIHLLLTDMIMPGMGGRVLAPLLVSEVPGLRVIYMSGYTDTMIVRQDLLTAGLAFLQKPFMPDALARKVREVLDAPLADAEQG